MKQNLRKRQARPVRRSGFTLIEVLIVLAILGVIAAMVVPRFIGQQRGANIKATQASIHGLEQALKLYAVDNQGEYPHGGQEVLQQLIQPRTDPQTGRQIEPVLDSMPLDAWGLPLYYEYPNNKVNIDEPAIWSSGPDKKNDDGAPDDVNNWSNLVTQ
jgi:general secretion pathway protein G